MIGKIYKFIYNDYDFYYRVLHFDTHNKAYLGEIIKCNSNSHYFLLGHQYHVYPDVSKEIEISEHDYNKIIVFE